MVGVERRLPKFALKLNLLVFFFPLLGLRGLTLK